MSVNATGKKTPLQKLRKAWKRADPSERAEFLLWLRDSGALEGEYAPEQDATVPVSSGRYLRPDAVRRIREVMTSRRLNPGDVMGELGFDPEDPSLHRAMTRSYGLRLVIIEALEKWLATHSGKS